MVETPVSMVPRSVAAVCIPKKVISTVVVIDRCSKCNPPALSQAGWRARAEFLERLRLHHEHTLIYPVDGGAHAIATDNNGVIKDLQTLRLAYPSIQKTIIITDALCMWYRDHKPCSHQGDLLEAANRLAEALPELKVELYHDTGRLIPGRIHLA